MEKKKCWAIIISVISLAIAITTAAFLICKNFQFGVEIDEGATFIGICTSLIGIFATVILGLQIWNHLEFSEAKGEINKIKDIRANIDSEFKKQKQANIEYSQHLGLSILLISQPKPQTDINLRCHLMLQGIILSSEGFYLQNNSSNIQHSMLPLLDDLKSMLEKTTTTYDIKDEYLDKFRNMQFPEKHRDYQDMIIRQAEIIKIIEGKRKNRKK